MWRRNQDGLEKFMARASGVLSVLELLATIGTYKKTGIRLRILFRDDELSLYAMSEKLGTSMRTWEGLCSITDLWAAQRAGRSGKTDPHVQGGRESFRL